MVPHPVAAADLDISIVDVQAFRRGRAASACHGYFEAALSIKVGAFPAAWVVAQRSTWMRAVHLSAPSHTAFHL